MLDLLRAELKIFRPWQVGMLMRLDRPIMFFFLRGLGLKIRPLTADLFPYPIQKLSAQATHNFFFWSIDDGRTRTERKMHKPHGFLSAEAKSRLWDGTFATDQSLFFKAFLYSLKKKKLSFATSLSRPYYIMSIFIWWVFFLKAMKVSKGQKKRET